MKLFLSASAPLPPLVSTLTTAAPYITPDSYSFNLRVKKIRKCVNRNIVVFIPM